MAMHTLGGQEVIMCIRVLIAVRPYLVGNQIIKAASYKALVVISAVFQSY